MLLWLGLKRRYLLVGWLWFLGTLIPMIGLVQVGSQSMADRYIYVPMWGLAMAAVWSICDLGDRWFPGATAQRAGLTATALLLVVLGARTYRQSGMWLNTITLFEDAVANTDRNWLAHGTLAGAYYDRGDFQRAIEHCREASQYDLNMGKVLGTYGMSLYLSGSPDEAIAKLEEATRRNPKSSYAQSCLGWVYQQTGKPELAAERFRLAARRLTDSDSPSANVMIYANWGKSLTALGRTRGAMLCSSAGCRSIPTIRRCCATPAQTDLMLRDPVRASDRLRRALGDRSAR